MSFQRTRFVFAEVLMTRIIMVGTVNDVTEMAHANFNYCKFQLTRLLQYKIQRCIPCFHERQRLVSFSKEKKQNDVFGEFILKNVVFVAIVSQIFKNSDAKLIFILKRK